MHTVDNAIIMAAGFGTRMRPLTYETPKPLIKVNGKAMIETVIDGLIKNNITDIAIVVGYMAEKFEPLTKKYPGLRLIQNPYYNKYNNISSLYVARFYLKNTIILDGDQVIQNPQILSKSFETSGYAGTWVNKWSDEWIMHTDKNGIVKSCDREGGQQGWRLYSLSRWTIDDSQKLRYLLEQEMVENHHTDIYWDDVPMFCYPNEFKLKVQPIKCSDIAEIDSIEQLSEVDRNYKKYL